MSEEARHLRCPECGGPNPGGTRECSYCKCPIATLRCAHCFRLNVPDDEHCGGCGEVLGLLPVELPSELTCPECKCQLQSFDGDPGHLHDCPSCSGQFVEHALLWNLIERRRRFADARPSRAKGSLAREVRYFQCPACQELMNRKNFGGTSGVIVDYCGVHGVWFQAGELPKVLSYVAAGGLADGRRIRLGLPAPRTERQQRETAAIIAEAMKRSPSGPPEPSGVAAVASGVAESALELLEVIGSFVLRSD